MKRLKNPCALAVALALTWCGMATAQADAVVTKVLDAWQKKRTAVKSARYNLSGTSKRTPASLSLPASDASPEAIKRIRLRPTPVSATILLDLEKYRYRIEWREETLSLIVYDFVPEFRIHTWDGKEFRGAMPREENSLGPGNSDLSIVTGHMSRLYLETMFEPVFSGHGLVPTVNSPLVPTGFPPRHDPEFFQHQGNVPRGGRNCVVLRTEPVNSYPGLTDEFWVDATQDYSVVRHVSRSGSNPSSQIDIDYQRTALGSTPKRWTLTSLIGGRVDSIIDLAVTDVEFNVPLSDNDFTIPIRPGMRVDKLKYPDAGSGLDLEMPAKETYIVEADGTLKQVGASGFTTLEGRQLPPDSRHPWWHWAALAGICAGALFVGCMYLRRRASRS